ncbi:MAG: hypothetical protein V2A59_00445 [Candidatus Omnitrophota bacterium]
MKRKVIKSAVSLILRFSVILTIFLTLSNLDFALAGDSLTLSVTCTIPAVAGLNAPMIEQESVRNTPTAQEMSAIQTPVPSMLQTENNMNLQEGTTVIPIITKTLYSR